MELGGFRLEPGSGLLDHGRRGLIFRCRASASHDVYFDAVPVTTDDFASRRNAGDATFSADVTAPLAPEERELVKRLAELPAVAADAGDKRGPQGIPQYAIRVADDFHRFYHEHRVLESEQQAFRLALCRATQTVIARCLDLVGVEAPERM